MRAGSRGTGHPGQEHPDAHPVRLLTPFRHKLCPTVGVLHRAGRVLMVGFTEGEPGGECLASHGVTLDAPRPALGARIRSPDLRERVDP
jgi:hypothetical protein